MPKGFDSQNNAPPPPPRARKHAHTHAHTQTHTQTHFAEPGFPATLNPAPRVRVRNLMWNTADLRSRSRSRTLARYRLLCRLAARLFIWHEARLSRPWIIASRRARLRIHTAPPSRSAAHAFLLYRPSPLNLLCSLSVSLFLCICTARER